MGGGVIEIVQIDKNPKPKKKKKNTKKEKKKEKKKKKFFSLPPES